MNLLNTSNDIILLTKSKNSNKFVELSVLHYIELILIMIGLINT